MPENAPRVHRFISNDLTLRASVVDATNVVKTMQSIQDTQPLPTVAVGRAMVGALLMASQLKEDQSVGVLIRSNGPIQSVYAEAGFNGQVRGYTPNSHYAPASYADGLSLKKHVGIGLLTVVRHLPFQRLPHQGTVELVSGEIGDDIAHYLKQSHQIRSLVSLGVYLDTYGKVRSAGGIIIEVMPGVEDEVARKIEDNALKIKTELSKELMAGSKPTDLIKPYLEGILYTELPHDHPIVYHCPCTKDRVLGAMTVLGVKDLDEMIAENKTTEVVCQMCGKPYEIEVAELQEVRNELHRQSLN